MSLINQMLQDLDARRATHSAETKLPNDVRPLPAVSTPRWPWAIGVVFVVAGLGGAIWWRMHEAVMDEVVPTKVAVDPAPVDGAVAAVVAGDADDMVWRLGQARAQAEQVADFVAVEPEIWGAEDPAAALGAFVERLS